MSVLYSNMSFVAAVASSCCFRICPSPVSIPWRQDRNHNFAVCCCCSRTAAAAAAAAAATATAAAAATATTAATAASFDAAVQSEYYILGVMPRRHTTHYCACPLKCASFLRAHAHQNCTANSLLPGRRPTTLNLDVVVTEQCCTLSIARIAL